MKITYLCSKKNKRIWKSRFQKLYDVVIDINNSKEETEVVGFSYFHSSFFSVGSRNTKKPATSDSSLDPYKLDINLSCLISCWFELLWKPTKLSLNKNKYVYIQRSTESQWITFKNYSRKGHIKKYYT